MTHILEVSTHEIVDQPLKKEVSWVLGIPRCGNSMMFCSSPKIGNLPQFSGMNKNMLGYTLNNQGNQPLSTSKPPRFFVPKSRLAPRSSRKSWDDFLNPVGRKGAAKKAYPGCFGGILVGDEIRKPSYLVDWFISHEISGYLFIKQAG